MRWTNKNSRWAIFANDVNELWEDGILMSRRWDHVNELGMSSTSREVDCPLLLPEVGRTRRPPHSEFRSHELVSALSKYSRHNASAEDCKQTGEVYSVEVLGALGLIDDGETDWKVVVIRAGTPREERLKRLEEQIDAIREWFRLYKTAEGKGENEIYDGGRFLETDEALEWIVHPSHDAWQHHLEESGQGPLADEASPAEEEL